MSSSSPAGVMPESQRSRGNDSGERAERLPSSLGRALFETKSGSRAVSRLRRSAPGLKPRGLRSRPNPVLPRLPLQVKALLVGSPVPDLRYCASLGLRFEFWGLTAD